MRIGVVIAALAVAQLVARQQHRHALRQQERGQKVTFAQITRRLQRGIWPLMAHIVGMVIRMAITTIFAIGEVVFNVERHQILQRKPIMRGDEIHRSLRRAGRMVELIGAAQNAARQVRHHPRIAPPKAAKGIARAVVPFGKGRGICPQLIAARPNIPRLGDQFNPRQNGVLPQRIKKPAARIKAMRLAPQNRGQIKPKPIDMHLLHPIAQAIHNQAQRGGMGGIQGVSRARIIHIIAPAPRQAVITGIVQPAKGQRGAKLIAFGAVVIDHIQNHLDPSAVQIAHHGLHLAQGGGGGGIARIWHKKADCVVSPMVCKPLFNQKPIINKGLNGQKFDRRYPQALQMGNHGRVGHARIGAAQRGRNIRVQTG